MADKKMVGSRPTTDDARETWSRVKAKKYSKGRKQPQSPCSLSYRKDFETPKRKLRNRFNGSSTGDSPSEAEALQDIIWDPASPPPVKNGKGAGEGVEISDLVKRIAPNDEKPVDSDLVLQWIGDSVIQCTPEIQLPRVRRVSTRRQSNNVEDLMKLAKQFDINMTRQGKEQQQNSDRRNTERLNMQDKSAAIHPVLEVPNPTAGVQASVPVKSEGLSHEEELHALFDGPTQHLSGRLSPPSVSGSQESRSELKDLSPKRSVSAQLSKPDFDDDWENDDLLNDSFVLQMTQNPELLSSPQKKSVDQTGSVTSTKCEPTSMASSSGSGSGAGCPPQLQRNDINLYTRILSKAQCTNTGTFRTRANTLVNSRIVQQPPKTSPYPVKVKTPENCHAKAQTSPCNWQQVITTVGFDRAKREIKGSEGVGAKDSDSSSRASGKDFKTLDSIWGDGDDDDDDDLLYQACDDMERISTSQEQGTQNSPIKLASTSATSSSTKATSSVDSTCFSNIIAKKTVQAGQPRECKQPARVFGRSHSIPGASTAFGNKQNLCETSQTTHSPQCNEQYKFTQLKNVAGAVLKPQWNAGPSHHSTFKRHQSDPVPLGNKVFVAAQPVVKCSAAEIEKKKQEAISRRRLRLQATQKPEIPT